MQFRNIFYFPFIGNIVTHYSFPPHIRGRKYRFSIALLRENRVFCFECGCTGFETEGLMDRIRTHFIKNEVCLFSSLHGKDYYLFETKGRTSNISELPWRTDHKLKRSNHRS